MEGNLKSYKIDSHRVQSKKAMSQYTWGMKGFLLYLDLTLTDAF